MICTGLRRALLAFVVLSLTACLGQSVPKRVVAGTTFALPFAATLTAATLPVVYGVEPSQNPGTLLASDRQRGNARFVLCTNPAPNCGTQRPLSLRYITRVQPDRGSPQGLAGPFQAFGIRFPLNQDYVVLDTPLSTPPGNYQLTYVFRPPGTSTDQLLTLESITVLPGTVEDFADFQNSINLGDVSAFLPALVPNPQITLFLADSGLMIFGGESLADRPASGTLVLRYPAAKVKIEGAFEGEILGQGSIVRMTPGPTTGPNANTVSILFLDPDQKIIQLRVAFSLLPTATAPAQPNDFSIDSQQLYKPDGTLLPSTMDPAAVGNSFKVGGIL